MKRYIVDTDKINKLFDLGLKDVEIAKRSHLSFTYIGKIRKGKIKVGRMGVEAAANLCKVYDELK